MPRKPINELSSAFVSFISKIEEPLKWPKLWPEGKGIDARCLLMLEIWHRSLGHLPVHIFISCGSPCPPSQTYDFHLTMVLTWRVWQNSAHHGQLWLHGHLMSQEMLRFYQCPLTCQGPFLDDTQFSGAYCLVSDIYLRLPRLPTGACHKLPWLLCSSYILLYHRISWIVSWICFMNGPWNKANYTAACTC